MERDGGWGIKSTAETLELRVARLKSGVWLNRATDGIVGFNLLNVFSSPRAKRRIFTLCKGRKYTFPAQCESSFEPKKNDADQSLPV
jgi:hypothetical protein